jgi:fructose/tagatose bisphosphate aldolase
MHLLCLPNATFSSFLVFHGGSGSTKEEIQTAVNNGAVKMNVDTGLYRLVDLCVIVLTVI